MPRARLEARLEVLDVQIGLARVSIEGQRKVIEEMRQKGYATGIAETQLTLIEARLTLHEAERTKLLAELAALRRS